MRRCIPTAAVVMGLHLTLGGWAQAVFITNGDFETVPGTGPLFQGQDLLPSGWQQVTVTPDTYSNDGSYGLFPGGFANFPGVTAFDGIRWVAGASFGRNGSSTTVGGESFGTTLAMTLTPGQEYQLDARLYQALRSDLDFRGGYHLFLAQGNTPPDLAGATLIGALAVTTGVDAWEPRSMTFTAPVDAGSRPFLIFAPYQQLVSDNSYPGIDAVSLTGIVVPEPASLTLVGFSSIGMLTVRIRKQVSTSAA